MKSTLVENNQFTLTKDELHTIDETIHALRHSFDSVESPDFAEACELEAATLPRRLRSLLNEIKNGRRNYGFINVRGFSIDDSRIGDSPTHWDVPWSAQPFLREEIFQCLISSALGHVFGWRTQENGRFLRHIVPIKLEEHEQLGSGSAATLLYHVEEAFHPARADLLTLMCYRNCEQARTNVVFVGDISLQPDVVAVLRQNRFVVEPDKSHMPSANKSRHWTLEAELFNRVVEMLNSPTPRAAISGASHRPTIVVDQAFMHALPGDDEAAAALDTLHAELSRHSRPLVMTPGDLLVIDNHTVVHGRSIYKPHYGPKQRWLRRVNISNGHLAYGEYCERDNYRVRM